MAAVSTVVPTSSESTEQPLNVACTGDWRENAKNVVLLNQALKALGVFSSATVFPQDKEGSNQALFLFSRLCDAGLAPEGVTILIAGGRGSTQATPIRKTGDKIEVLEQDRASGFPREPPVPTEDKTAMVKRLRDSFPDVALIVLTDSFYHLMKVLEPAPTVPDKGSLPKSVELTGRAFPLVINGTTIEFVAEVFSDTPTLSIRNFKDSAGNLCKGTFIVSDRPTVDLGTGKARLVNPKTGTAIEVDGQEEVELPDDWQTNPDSISEVATAISRMQVAASTWSS